MTEPTETPATAEAIASDAHSIAVDLRAIASNNDRSRALGFALLAATIVNISLIVLVVFLFIPIYRTARIVQRVAGPNAIAQQQADSQVEITQLLTQFICTQRENTSESRVMDGKVPLPVRPGCDPYDFNPADPVLPPPAAATAKPKTKKATTTTGSSSTSSPSTTPTTTTTLNVVGRCPSLTVVGTCLTVPTIPKVLP